MKRSVENFVVGLDGLGLELGAVRFFGCFLLRVLEFLA